MRASFDNSNQQSLQAQLAQLQAQAQTNGRSGYGFDRGLQDRITALQSQMNMETMKANAANKPVDEVADAKKKILDYTAGRGDATLNDAMTNAALSRLDKVSGGQDAPFTSAVQNQMLAQQAGMHASAADDQAQQLRMQAAGIGGSLADPSYQARLRQVNSQRQSANANAQGQIATTAQLQNFGARQQATNSMLGGRMGQMGMANSQYNQAAGYLNQTTQDSGHQSAVAPITYNFGSMQPQQLQNQQQQVQPYPTQAAPKPAAATPQAQQPTPSGVPQTVIHADNAGYGYQPPAVSWGSTIGAPQQPAFNATPPPLPYTGSIAQRLRPLPADQPYSF